MGSVNTIYFHDALSKNISSKQAHCNLRPIVLLICIYQIEMKFWSYKKSKIKMCVLVKEYI